MFDAILIDDEHWALESLYRVFPWERFGFRVVGSYTDALEGWDAIQRLQPDVVFVDNCMPEKRGLEMAGEARLLPSVPLFVIVSGYSDFCYVKQALQLNVFDYCLKPVSREDAAGLLERLRCELEARRMRRNAEMLDHIQNGMDAKELFALNRLPVRGEWWRVAVLRYANAQDLEWLRTALAEESACFSWLGVTKLMVVVNGSEEAGGALERCLTSADLRPELMVGLSQAHSSRDEFWQCISEARGCAYCDFINPQARLVTYHAKESDAVEHYVSMLVEAISARNAQNGAALVRQLPELFRSEGVQMHSLCRYWIRLMNAFKQAGGDALELKLEWISKPEDMYMMMSDGVEGLAGELASYLELQTNGGDAREGVPPGQNFAEIVEYVDAHYRERLKLDALAKHFHLNTAYCSEVFKRVAGMTFTDYVTKLRMEYAHRKLSEGNCNLQDLALEVGYGDYFTFSKRFKKYYGVSPSCVNR